MKFNRTTNHMTIPPPKSTVLTCASEAFVQWKFHPHHDCPLQATNGFQVSLCRTQRQET